MGADRTAKLHTLAAALKAHPGARLRIAGNCDAHAANRRDDVELLTTR